MPEASPFWQNAFLVFILVVVAWSVFSGWRAGIVREVLALVGIVAGGFVGLSVGSMLGPLLGRFLPLPGLLLGLIAGVAVAVGIYLLCWFLGALLFKRTAQQRTALLRFIYGAGGGLVGLAVGATFLWSALLLVRGLGGFYEAGFSPKAAPDLPVPNAIATGLVKLKRSIAEGPAGRSLEAFDIVPKKFYRILEKCGSVTTQPAAMKKFFEYPGLTDIMRDPKIVALESDPGVSVSAREKQLGALVQNPKVLEAASDPALIAKLQKIDIEKALDYALSPSAPSHSPHPPHP